MKLAVIFYGHMREYGKTLSTVRSNLLDKYDCDVFIHTWDEIEAQTKSWHKTHMPNRPLKDEDVRVIKKFTKPIAIKVESQHPNLVNDRTGKNKISYQGQKFMLYSLNEANRLRLTHESQSGTIYDAVLKIRPDVAFFEPFTVPIPHGREVFISARRREPGNTVHSFSVCDVINIATPKMMTEICNAVDHFDQFYLDDVPRTHTAFIDYLFFLKADIKMLTQVYGPGKTWGLFRKAGFYA